MGELYLYFYPYTEATGRSPSLVPSRSTCLFYVPVCSHECWCCNHVMIFACDKLFRLVDIDHETYGCGVTIVISTRLVLPECPMFCDIVKLRDSDECYWFVSNPSPPRAHTHTHTHTLLWVPQHFTSFISRSSSLWANCSNVQHCFVLTEPLRARRHEGGSDWILVGRRVLAHRGYPGWVKVTHSQLTPAFYCFHLIQCIWEKIAKTWISGWECMASLS